MVLSQPPGFLTVAVHPGVVSMRSMVLVMQAPDESPLEMPGITVRIVTDATEPPEPSAVVYVPAAYSAIMMVLPELSTESVMMRVPSSGPRRNEGVSVAATDRFGATTSDWQAASVAIEATADKRTRLRMGNRGIW